MFRKLHIKEFLSESSSVPVIDVRSPSEYHQGHIPGAVNLPLFSDIERKAVGTLYKKKGRIEAINAGFEIIAGKYTSFTREALSFSGGDKALVYCWRGGMRSGTVAWLLAHLGVSASVLINGYKSYRKLIREFFSRELNLKIVGGMTGTGKTEVLGELVKRGYQVVDLEAIACHKGSAFGALGENHQPTTEHFENLLLWEFLKLDTNGTIWLENESQSIGRVFLPPELFRQMKSAPLYNLEIPEEKRLERLVRQYSCFKNEELIACLDRIQRKIGGQNYKTARIALKEKDYRRFASMALKYYDKTYRFGLEKRNPASIVHLQSETGDAAFNASLIEEL